MIAQSFVNPLNNSTLKKSYFKSPINLAMAYALLEAEYQLINVPDRSALIRFRPF